MRAQDPALPKDSIFDRWLVLQKANRSIGGNFHCVIPLSAKKYKYPAWFDALSTLLLR
jgi:hypothetical protein